MELNQNILVLGARGMVGSAIVRELKNQGYKNILTPTRQELDLLNQSDVLEYFINNKPEYVFLAAAKVGGILANDTFRGDFIFENLTMQNNIFNASLKTKIKKLQFLGSSCIYPKMCPQPMKEEYLLTGPLEPTNDAYAIAKIAGLKTAENLKRQYGVEYFSVMPTNLYGVNDNFHPENSHVIPGLIQRMQKTIDNGDKEFTVWGTGTPKREFLYVDDLASACVYLMNTKEELPFWINIGTGEEISIKMLAETLAKAMGMKAKIIFDPKYPDGTPRKLLDVSKANQLGWKAQTSLQEGLKKAVGFYRTSENIRSC